jgi:hypothetical protein
MMSEQSLRDLDLRAECQAIHHRFVDAVARILGQGISEGAFRPMDPAVVAQMLKATLDGFAGQAAIGIHPEEDRIATEGFRMILRGVLANPELADTLIPTP